MFTEKFTNELYQEGYTKYDTDICRIEISIDNVLKMNFSSLSVQFQFSRMFNLQIKCYYFLKTKVSVSNILN